MQLNLDDVDLNPGESIKPIDQITFESFSNRAKQGIKAIGSGIYIRGKGSIMQCHKMIRYQEPQNWD